MKKLIYIAFIGLMFSGCDDTSFNSNDTNIVNMIESYGDYTCKYHIHSHYGPSIYYIDIYDSCGKFQIGDTLGKLNRKP